MIKQLSAFVWSNICPWRCLMRTEGRWRRERRERESLFAVIITSSSEVSHIINKLNVSEASLFVFCVNALGLLRANICPLKVGGAGNQPCPPFFLFAEIEAKEACDWLRAAGFPQYVQLFKGKYETIHLMTMIYRLQDQLIHSREQSTFIYVQYWITGNWVFWRLCTFYLINIMAVIFRFMFHIFMMSISFYLPFLSTFPTFFLPISFLFPFSSHSFFFTLFRL